MTKPGRKPPTGKGRDPDEQPDPIEGGPDADESPRNYTAQNREMKPGALTREEIRERTHRNKQ
jgi:hypothetical protein